MFQTLRQLLDETYVRISGIVLLGLLVMFVAFAGRSCGRDKLADPARERLMTKCAAELGEGACRNLIEQNHDLCARRAYESPKYAAPSFNEVEYDGCIMQGSQAYYEARRRERKQQGQE